MSSKVQLIKNDLDLFFRAPREIYPKEFPYISQFKSDLGRFLSLKNPLFRSDKDFAYYTALRDGRIVGRITTHIHHASNERFQLRRSYFGYFDCIDDIEVARALLEKAEEFARIHNCNEVAGNFNLTAMQMAGVVTHIYRNEHYSDQVFAPVYIADLLRNCGYREFFPMSTYEVQLSNFDPESLLGPKQRSILIDPRWKLKKLGWMNFKQILEDTRICLNDGFSDNPMFVPLSWEEMYFQAKDLMLIVDKHISVVAYFGNRPVGALICIPNLNNFLQKTGSQMGWSAPFHLVMSKFKRESAIFIFYSVCKDFHIQGVNGVMMYEVMRSLKDRGYQRVGGTWIGDDNKVSLRHAEKVGSYKMHDLNLFRKLI